MTSILSRNVYVKHRILYIDDRVKTNYSEVVMKMYHSLLEDSIRLNADTTINDELCQWVLCKEIISHSSYIMHPHNIYIPMILEKSNVFTSSLPTAFTISQVYYNP